MRTRRADRRCSRSHPWRSWSCRSRGSTAPDPGPRAAGSRGGTVGRLDCPHGGGPDLSVALFLANPGEAAATARLTQLGAEAASPPEHYDVPGGTTLRVDLAPGARGDATFVEFFGGWIGAGWVSYTDAGAAAEPCAAEASQRWFLADGSTELGEESYVVVANPFSGHAVMDVVLYSADQPPVRQSEWTDLVVPAGRSVALHLNEQMKESPWSRRRSRSRSGGSRPHPSS